MVMLFNITDNIDDLMNSFPSFNDANFDDDFVGHNDVFLEEQKYENVPYEEEKEENAFYEEQRQGNSIVYSSNPSPRPKNSLLDNSIQIEMSQ